MLIVTPLAVTFQTETEAAKFGIEAAISRDGTIPAGVTVTNYERLEHFDPASSAGWCATSPARSRRLTGSAGRS